ncbi:MAG: putative glycoside hydrolase [Candidatus Hinthialibacter antarcticus]|nr:putative glycoside hydrolase [Candidatus Hinthialibacter antarcticus]
MMKQALCLFVSCLVANSAFAQNAEIKPIMQRITDRTFPSIFMAWAPADGLDELGREQNIAKHDLAFMGEHGLKLQWDRPHVGLAVAFNPDSVKNARAMRRELLRLNPNQIVLMEIRYRDAWSGFLPEDHEWWKRDDKGDRVVGWEEGGYYILDFSNPAYRAHVAKQAKAALDTGAVDGVMLDWWIDDEDRLALIKTIRDAIGEDALILVNANDRKSPMTAPYINGYFMECWRSKTPGDWRRIAETLRWAEENLREPRINCVETWYENSRRDFSRMRATTCLALTHSDGYALFSDPNDLPTGDHQHDWYSFWDKQLGRPIDKGVIHETGWAQREFERGAAVYNPMGNTEIKITFNETRTRLSTGEQGTVFSIPPLDGDLFLK